MMDDIRQMQYNNLRKCFNQNLVEPILGKNYYNMSQDVYTADKVTTEDLKREFDWVNNGRKFFKIAFIVSLTINGILIVSKLL